MKLEDFLGELEKLTGTAVKKLTDSESRMISQILRNDDKFIDYTQFNELLLSANKNRVEAGFFKYFFGSAKKPAHCKIKDIPSGVERFRKRAMLCYGNFIYAYRKLSKTTSDEELQDKLHSYYREPKKLLRALKERPQKLLDIEPIPRDDTYLTGYLSAGEIVAENKRADYLLKILTKSEISFEDIIQRINADYAQPERKRERNELLSLLNRFNNSTGPKQKPAYVRRRLAKDKLVLEKMKEKTTLIQEKAERNTDVYLTWDHMDIYFATSMRKRWEFEDLFDFVARLMQEKELAELNIRYFDPTQSFDKNRIDKGLIESLMLKRAACTVYSVQDTDTLGKDSELAATLAQGKPVIAYVPEVDVAKRTRQLINQRPVVLKERFNFCFSTYDGFVSEFANDMNFINKFNLELGGFEERVPWKSFCSSTGLAKFFAKNNAELNRFCTIISQAEKQIYDNRARTLLERHPLAIQVNIDTGVANGVLVVRNIKKCAKLLRQILTNQLEFQIKHDDETECWHLIEQQTGSIHRVVTDNPKLTNCFWNFYQRIDNKESL